MQVAGVIHPHRDASGAAGQHVAPTTPVETIQLQSMPRMKMVIQPWIPWAE